MSRVRVVTMGPIRNQNLILWPLTNVLGEN